MWWNRGPAFFNDIVFCLCLNQLRVGAIDNPDWFEYDMDQYDIPEVPENFLWVTFQQFVIRKSSF